MDDMLGNKKREDSAIENYIFFLQAEKNCSIYTIKGYRRDLYQFLFF
ncbi:hypothetical protein [Natranaerofaba carboxydovora]|nr:hypothetical protein [Natranaerofaba carboxydovora]